MKRTVLRQKDDDGPALREHRKVAPYFTSPSGV